MKTEQDKLVKSHEGDNIFAGAEGRMVDADGKLLAAVTGSSAANAVDGSDSSFARPATSKPWTYTALLENRRKINDLTITFDEKTVPDKFKVKVSNDGVNWEEVYSAEEKIEGNSVTIPCGGKIVNCVSVELVSGKMAIREISAMAVDFLVADEEDEENIKLVTFYDINGHWGKEAIEYCASRGYVNGNDYGMFLPDDKVTRAEFAAMLLRTRDDMQKVSYDGRFLDIPDNAWYADYIIPMVNSRVFADEMIANGYILPTQNLTRDEMAYMIVMITGVELIPDVENVFADNASAAVWSVPYINTAKELGLIAGMDDTNFKPKFTLTRAEAATVIMRTLKELNIEKEPVTDEADEPQQTVPEVTEQDTTEPEIVYDENITDNGENMQDPTIILE